MVEAQTWTTRLMSNLRLLDASSSPAADLAVDIPATPPSDVRNGTGYSTYGGSFPLTPTLSTAAIIGSWYLSNIGVLLLNKYLLSYFGYNYPIFLTMLHMLSGATYSYVTIHLLELVPR